MTCGSGMHPPQHTAPGLAVLPLMPLPGQDPLLQLRSVLATGRLTAPSCVLQ